MSAPLVAAVLGAAGLGGIAAAIITGLFSSKKLGAEATEIITKAAAGVVTSVQNELDRQVERNKEMIRQHRQDITTLMEDHNRELVEVQRVLQLHVSWDVMAKQKLGDLGIDLPDAPPLLPAKLFERRTPADYDAGTLDA